MRMRYNLFIGLILISSSLNAQTLSGSVSGDNGMAITNASVSVAALHRTVVADNAGKFAFGNIPQGSYVVEFSLIGYKKETRHVTMVQGDVVLNVTLTSTPLELAVLTVTAEPEPASIAEASLSTTVVEGRELRRERGQSLGQTIEYAPGVAAFSGSPMSMKPVIRGLSAQRVLVVAGGVRLESQTWDEPQSPEINVLDVDRIEIVRGTNSVLYGSDALGGVVNVVKSELQSSGDGAPTLRGNLTMNAFSNSPQVGSGISVMGASNAWSYRGNFSGRYAGDYTAPAGRTASGTRVSAGSVFNSGGNEINGSASVGTKREWGTFMLDATHFGQKYFIAPEPGRKEYELNINTGGYDSLSAAPSQEILHETATAYASLPLSFARLELTGTYQRNSRKEEGVAETDADEQKKADLGIKPEAQLILNTFSLDAKAHHHALGPLNGTVGISATYQSNSTEGQKSIIPNFTALNLAGFVYEGLRIVNSVRLTGGLRYDTRSLKAEADTQLTNAAQTLNFNAVSGTIGCAWNIDGPLTLAVNAGRGWRAPVAAELFFKGSDEGAVRYKVGDQSLVPEVSLNVESSLRYSSPVVSAEISVYQNTISHYIFLTPTGQKASGLDVYGYRQSDATIVGGEFSLQASVAAWCILEGGVDMLRGTDNSADAPLPLIPANRLKGGVRLISGEWNGVHDAYILARVRSMQKQDRISLFESVTPAYSLVELGVGGEVTVATYRCELDIIVTNALDQAYYDHLSRYKEYALDPGRNIQLKLSVPFEIIQ